MNENVTVVFFAGENERNRLYNSARKWRVLSNYTGMTRKLSYYTVQLQAWRVHCPISAQIGQLITNRIREFCYSFD